MISLAMIILIVLSLTLAIRDFFPNAVGGIVIAKKKMLNIGDTIEIDNIKGKVNKLSLIAVEVITKKGDLIYIPNSLISKKILIKKR
jgi:small-conductance mechanosensitive channel